MIDIIYKKAFSELYEIFKIMPEELLNRIPKDFIEMIKEERDKKYFPDIKEPLEKCELMEETQILLGLIYGIFIEGK